MRKILKEFKQFAVKGNVLDLAIGVIIGGAFGKIVSSLVSDVIMPMIGIILGKINLASLSWTPVDGISIHYGSFLQVVLDFLIIAFSIFLMVKAINRLKTRQKEDAPPKLSDEVKLLTEIRDILKEKDDKSDDSCKFL